MTVDVTADDRVLRDVGEARSYVAGVCFKTGPPALIGVELEWTVHHADDPQRPLQREIVAHALHPHAPADPRPPRPRTTTARRQPTHRRTGRPGRDLRPPQPSLTALRRRSTADIDHLTDLLARAGLRLGDRGIDPHRSAPADPATPRATTRWTRRFDAARSARADHDVQHRRPAGLPRRRARRPSSPTAGRAVHALGPAAGRPVRQLPPPRRPRHRLGVRPHGARGWRIDPAPHRAGRRPTTTRRPPGSAYALDAPVLCVRRPTGRVAARRPASPSPTGSTARSTRPPTVDDLDYHLTTLFPPVRPRGYLEVRYLDTQPGGEWIAPAARAHRAARRRRRDRRAPGRVRAGRRPLARRRPGTGWPTRRCAAAARGLAELAADRLDRTRRCRRADRDRRARRSSTGGSPADDRSETHDDRRDRPTCATAHRRRAGPGPRPHHRADRRRRRRRPDPPALAADVAAGLGPRAHRQPGGAVAGARRRRPRAGAAGHRRPLRRVPAPARRPAGAAAARPGRGPRATSREVRDKVLDVLDRAPLDGRPAARATASCSA